jgi:hypothetical protein
MFNNIALQVAIGLAFTYLLYSLLATTLQEFVATLFAYRERMLERGIEQMLDGENFSYYWWDKVINWLIWFFRYRKLDQQQFLSRVSFDKDELIKNGLTSQPTRMVLNEKAPLFSTRIIQHPLYRRAAIDNKFSKKPAYLSSDTFSDILIAVLSVDKSTGQAVPPLLKDISAQVKVQTENNPGLKQILDIYIDQANGDVQRFKSLVENWYNDTMDRVSGWYKRQTTRILFIIGILLAIVFNVDTIRLVSILSVNQDERTAFVDQAAAYMKSHPGIDTTVSGIKAVENNYNSIATLYKNTLLKGDSAVALGWGNYGGHKDFFPKLWYVLGATFCPFCPGFSWTKLLGFLITAFAVSLGAPFWFDLLNKFINLRVSGQKPDDPAPGTSKTPGLNQTPNTQNPKGFA